MYWGIEWSRWYDGFAELAVWGKEKHEMKQILKKIDDMQIGMAE